MKLPLFLLVVLMVIIVPVSAKIVPTGGNIDIAHAISAQNNALVFSSQQDEKISIVEFDLPIGTEMNFTLTYGTGSTVDGYCSYRAAAIAGISHSEIAIGSDVWSEDFIDAQVAGYALTKHVQFTSYARNDSANPVTGGFAIYAQGYGIFSSEIAFYEVHNLPQNLISSIDFTANQPVSYTIQTTKTERMKELVSTTTTEYSIGAISKIFNDAISYAFLFGGLFLGMLYWLKFLFWDNFAMVAVLFLVVPAAYAANKCKDMECFFRRYFGVMKGLALFVVTVFNGLLDLVAKFWPFK